MGASVVLIVEDDPDALFLLQRALFKARLAQPIRMAVDGEQALAYLSGDGWYADRETHPLPCLVLLDLRLPKKSGIEVLEWMRTQVRLRKIPVIIVTASDENQDRVRAMELGARDYHMKPIDGGGLQRLARRVQT